MYSLRSVEEGMRSSEHACALEIEGVGKEGYREAIDLIHTNIPLLYLL